MSTEEAGFPPEPELDLGLPVEAEARPPCDTPVFPPGEDSHHCGTRSRFRIERQPIPDAPEWKNSGWSPEDVCEVHIAEALAYLADGDSDVRLTVTLHWNRPGEPAGDGWRSSVQYGVAGTYPAGREWVNEYDDEQDAAEHVALYAPDAHVVRRTVVSSPWERVSADV
jgi:hypothetical protein